MRRREIDFSHRTCESIQAYGDLFSWRFSAVDSGRNFGDGEHYYDHEYRRSEVD